MSYIINESCINCGACSGSCPVDAILEGDSRYEINPDTCIDCGACAGTCPVDAIHPG
jgi:ferredoxin